jgi:trigger factor
MKKRLSLLVLSMSMILLAAGCNSKTDDNKNATATPTPASTEGTDTEGATGTEATATPIPTVTNDLVREEYNLDDYIKLGQYKGVEVTVSKLEVSPEDLAIAIQSDLQTNGGTLTEVTGRAVQVGDTVNMDYEGLKDGVAFEGGTAAAYDLMVGSGAFIPGFEDQLIGAKTGDKLAINVTFPENYGAADLAGQPVVFNVTINKIQEYPLTDEFVTANTDYDTVDAYKTSVSDNLKSQNDETMKTELQNNVYNAVVANSAISSLPQTLIDYYANDLKVYYTNYAAAYGMDFATFLSTSGVTEDKFTEDAQDYAKSMATRDLVLGAVIKAEGIELSEDEYNEQVEAYAAQYGYENGEALLAAADAALLREDILYKKVQDFLVGEAVVK